MDARIARTAAGAKDGAASAAATGASEQVTYQPSEALDPGQAPVDAERVAVIRHAIESGTYPVIPTKIADAMIAAGMLLRAQA
ncbi:flagellar biosynthesis anti-sigma factor FlgM [Novosphingobium flavum]|uniref:Negative regulator of flagellin synthesis n=2 Tax=Novosphingobium flavum TaxID=1778672 RepID=A0A7X1FRH4_9SPHN|nr:flagellar biosynthesis anti-sigma factor FlgM [Novosphingobium flavum]